MTFRKPWVSSITIDLNVLWSNFLLATLFSGLHAFVERLWGNRPDEHPVVACLLKWLTIHSSWAIWMLRIYLLFILSRRSNSLNYMVTQLLMKQILRKSETREQLRAQNWVAHQKKNLTLKLFFQQLAHIELLKKSKMPSICPRYSTRFKPTCSPII